MRLFIAEKPSLAKAIAEGLTPDYHKEGQVFKCGADVVAWCAGHIMEQVTPEAYNPSYKQWNLTDLPIVPLQWKLKVTNDPLYMSIQKYIRTADIVVNAGDPDREGQLLVDEVINHIGTSKPIKRLLVNDLNLSAVQKALADIRDNRDFLGLSESALARSRADWLFGLNMTRLYTLLGRESGYDQVLSVGRVQTPVLGLVVRRDLAIENFKAKPYFTVTCHMNSAQGEFNAHWKPGAQSAAFLDDEGRLLDQNHADHIKATLDGRSGQVASVEVADKKELPPLPFALKDLQILAAKKLSLSPDRTLEVIQSLYETHKVITYPRSDCAYLPEGHTAEIDQVIAAIAVHSSPVSTMIELADRSLRSKAWNDQKITAHHAIIPTTHANPVELSADEAAVYELIAVRYLLQFYPAHEYRETQLHMSVEKEMLTAKGRVVTQIGWRGAYKVELEDDDEELEGLPYLTQGAAVSVKETFINHKMTQPPKYFTDATLLAAMSGIARFVENPELKRILQDSDGIGTPATQASIIKTLFERNYLIKHGKNIRSTEIGRSLISVLPDIATLPDMTAVWEKQMSQIAGNELSLDSFLLAITRQLTALIMTGKKQGQLSIPGVQAIPCPTCQQGTLRRRKGPKGFFWGCSNYPECKQTYPDEKGHPKTTPDPEYACPTCKTGVLRKRKGSAGAFWGCSNYASGCKQTFNDYRGKPDFKAKPIKKALNKKF